MNRKAYRSLLNFLCSRSVLIDNIRTLIKNEKISYEEIMLIIEDRDVSGKCRSNLIKYFTADQPLFDNEIVDRMFVIINKYKDEKDMKESFVVFIEKVRRQIKFSENYPDHSMSSLLDIERVRPIIDIMVDLLK